MQQSVTDTIPYFRDLPGFYKHVKARPPLDKDFGVFWREISEIKLGYIMMLLVSSHTVAM